MDNHQNSLSNENLNSTGSEKIPGAADNASHTLNQSAKPKPVGPHPTSDDEKSEAVAAPKKRSILFPIIAIILILALGAWNVVLTMKVFPIKSASKGDENKDAAAQTDAGDDTQTKKPSVPSTAKSSNAAPFYIAGNRLGENVTWYIDETEDTLYITGEGDMWDFDSSFDYGRTALPYAYNQYSKIVISDGVTSIGNLAFYNCYNVKKIEIPDSVTRIGDMAFAECGELESINIPAGVESIGNVAFAYCYSLNRITVDADNKYYCAEDGVLFDKDMETLIFYPAVKNGSDYDIPKGVTKIEDYAFCNNVKLASIVIPEGVTTIGNYAFSDCGSIKSIKFPKSLTTVGESAFRWCYEIKRVEFSEGLKSIGEGAFSYCNSLEKAEIPESVIYIGDEAFEECAAELEIYFYGSKYDWEELVDWEYDTYSSSKNDNTITVYSNYDTKSEKKTVYYVVDEDEYYYDEAVKEETYYDDDYYYDDAAQADDAEFDDDYYYEGEKAEEAKETK